MQLILNEKKYTEKMLEKGTFEKKDIGIVISLLSKYMFQEKQTKKDTYAFVEEFISNTIEDFDINQWYSFIDKCISKAKKRDLLQIDYIPITQKELDYIKTANSIQKERLLFTLLVIAKYNNIKSETNNSWINYPNDLFFKLARVACPINERNKLIFELKEAGFLEISKKLNHPNIRITFVDKGEPVLKITDMRELGYQYQQIYSPSKYRACKSCGKIYKIKSSKARNLYCRDCREEKPLSTGYKFIKCELCGKKVLVSIKNSRTSLCPEHQHERTNEQKRKFIRNKRSM